MCKIFEHPCQVQQKQICLKLEMPEPSRPCCLLAIAYSHLSAICKSLPVLYKLVQGVSRHLCPSRGESSQHCLHMAVRVAQRQHDEAYKQGNVIKPAA
jgi:hypothetical protein